MSTRVLFVPGAGCSASMYAKWEEVLRNDGLDITTVLYPGHGQGGDPGGLSLCQYRDAVEDATDRHSEKASSVILISHSMGAVVSLLVAEHNPMVKGLVLINPAPPAGIAIGVVPVLRMLWRHRYRKALITGGSFEFHPHDLKHLFLNGRRAIDSTGQEYSFQKESGKALWQLASGHYRIEPDDIFCPVHVFSGMQDRLIHTGIHKKVSDLYSGNFHSLPSVSHMPMFDPLQGHVIHNIGHVIQEMISPKVLPLKTRRVA